MLMHVIEEVNGVRLHALIEEESQALIDIEFIDQLFLVLCAVRDRVIDAREAVDAAVARERKGWTANAIRTETGGVTNPTRQSRVTLHVHEEQ